MTGHVFISYRHTAEDSAYVESLARYLSSHGLVVWYDKEIVTGDRWDSVIRDKIDNCAAFLVVMTPAAEGSQWITREIDQAEHQHKPIFPLLRRGERFFRLCDLRYEDVRSGRLPPARFVERIQSVATHAAPPHRFGSPTPRSSDGAVAVRLFGAAAFLTSVIGMIFLLTARFSGWQVDSSSEKRYASLIASSSGAPTYSYFLMVLGLVLLSYPAAIGLLTLFSLRAGLRRLTSAFYGAVATVVLTLVSALIFLIDASRDSQTWLDVGFWGILVTSVLTAFVLRMCKASIG